MQPGTIIARQYRITAEAGRGGMGTVLEARDAEGKKVALKVLEALDDANRARFEREARILQELRHPAIVRYLDRGVTDEGAPFIVMEWLQGRTLAFHLRQRRLDIAETVALASRVAGALAVAHDAGVVHRDVKPGNIFVPDADLDRAKLLDFGIANWVSAFRELTATGTRLGTPAYMAPEQVRDSRAITPSTDVFALGCVLHQCLTGDAVFHSHDPMAALFKILFEAPLHLGSLLPGIPAELDELVARMLSKDPAERPQNGGELVREIAARSTALHGDPGAESPRARPVGITDREKHLVSVIVAARYRSADEPGGIINEGFDTDIDGELDARFDELPIDELIDQRIDALLDEQTGEWGGARVGAGRAGSDDGARDSAGDRIDDELDGASALAVMASHFRAIGARWERVRGSLVAVLDNRGEATDRACEAARCALALHERFPRIPVALATGWAVIGQNAVIGEVIERAVGLLAHAPAESASPILIDNDTASLLHTSFKLERGPSSSLLFGERDLVSERRVMGRATPFVGRGREMATLGAALDDCIDESVAQAVLVTGPAGIGKSRLMRELVRRIRARSKGIEIWLGRCDRSRAGSSLGAMAAVIQHLSDIQDGEPPEVRADKLRERVARHVPEERQHRVASFLGELVRVPFPDDDDVALRAARRDPRLMADQIQRACENFIAAELAHHPVVIAVDDLHWGDRATVQILDQALRNLAEQPLLVVALARPQVRQVFPSLWTARHVTELRLGGLSRRASQTFVRAVLDQPEAAAVNQLVRRAEGNPFFLEELVRSAGKNAHDASAGDARDPSSRHDTSDPGRHGTAGDRVRVRARTTGSIPVVRRRTTETPEPLDPAATEIPASILAVVQARLNDLEPRARRLLRAASLFGHTFWRSGVIAVVGGEPDADELLDDLIAREVVAPAATSRFPDDVEYDLCHDVIRECAYNMLTSDDRVRGHRLAGRWLEAVGEPDARTLAEHFFRGGEALEAIGHWIRATAAALDSGDFQAVHELVERAVECGAQGEELGELRRMQIEVYLWQGSYAEVENLSEEAMVLVPRGSRAWYTVVGHAGMAWSKLGRHARVDRLLQSLAAARGDAGDHGGRMVAQLRVASELYLAGRRAQADALWRIVEAEREAGDLDDPAVAARYHEACGIRTYVTEGDVVAVLAEYEKSVAAYEAIGDLRHSCYDRSNLAYSKIVLGLYDEAVEDLQRSLEMADHLGLTIAVANARGNLGHAMAAMGRLDEAVVLQREAAESFAQQRDWRQAAGCEIDLAVTFIQAEQFDDAERELARALDRLPEGAAIRPLALATRARVALARGDAASAVTLADEARRLADEAGHIEEGRAWVELTQARALHASGQGDAARTAIGRARDRLRERARGINRPDWRHSFLHNIAPHAEILALAEDWLE